MYPAPTMPTRNVLSSSCIRRQTFVLDDARLLTLEAISVILEHPARLGKARDQTRQRQQRSIVPRLTVLELASRRA